ncbi:YdeI/OmpD-associated family protein [Glutamicibacter sp. MNS18]|uniref:YdeI/OmpD-associated family protein n=1 Tax=Glutamicibacter sp. MNS18 TaxID=2989817 RepID=UPI002236800E|nr:YdeI/OmpD-associated family protein [Glutamicibacter sp. MNS18]MCW4463940.1 YdeI/OmpD-associated family protein [Glutamicibacter sp. MNS18]
MDNKNGLMELGGATRRIGDRLILEFDEASSRRLPSRGQVAVQGTINGQEHTLVIEPDGRRGHWLPLDRPEAAALASAPGQQVGFTAQLAARWPETALPADLAAALQEATDLEDTWQSLTPMARWEWVRWVKSTKNPDTRQRRVEVSISKLRDGKRRPCCFDLSSCTDPEVAKSGKLAL